jgi:nucleoside-specific outer membrane channel protein Tsx
MIKTLILVLFMSVITTVTAKTVWSDYSITYLKGSHYEVGDTDKTVYTFEYATGTTWGDSFMFFDRLESDNGDRETYGEWSPRIKLVEFDNVIIKSLSLSSTIEMGTFSGADSFGFSFTNYLVGAGVDINLPHFNFFQVNLYRRNNDTSDNNYQTTVVWAIPIAGLTYTGFLDYTSSTNGLASSFNLTSQLKYDIAPHFDLNSKLYLGVEYVYWNNKFGIQDIDERNMNLLIKYHF